VILVACGAEIRRGPTSNLFRKKLERLIVSLFILSLLFLRSKLHFLYYATKLCKQPRHFFSVFAEKLLFQHKSVH
jgi:hypothetical protein